MLSIQKQIICHKENALRRVNGWKNKTCRNKNRYVVVFNIPLTLIIYLSFYIIQRCVLSYGNRFN